MNNTFYGDGSMGTTGIASGNDIDAFYGNIIANFVDNVYLTGTPTANFNYNCSDQSFPTGWAASPDYNVYSDPMLNDPADHTNEDWGYSLTWTLDEYSPCIDTGNPAIEDPDGTRSDIGAFYYPQHTETYSFPDLEANDEIAWISFPTVYDRYEGGYYHNQILEMLDLYTAPIPPNDPDLMIAKWLTSGNSGYISYESQSWGGNQTYRITPPYGFKLSFNVDEVDDLVLTGRKAIPEEDAVPLYSDSNTGRTYQNWIGYFVRNSQSPLDAFSLEVPNEPGTTYLDYMYKITTQRWSMVRLSQTPGSPWISTPGNYLLNYKDCVEVKVFANAPEEMFWNPATEEQRDEGFNPPPTQYFDYTQQFNYTPVFVVTDDDNPPLEIAAYVDTLCIGAAVVQDTLTQIRAYLPSLNRDDESELSIVLYYGGRGGEERLDSYRVFNPSQNSYVTRRINLNENADYYMISLREPEAIHEKFATGIQGVWPNPFNPDTNIRFSLASEGNAELRVYNIRGQLVKTLVSGAQSAGAHEVTWHGRDDHDRPVASGVYLLRLSAGGHEQTQKVLLLK